MTTIFRFVGDPVGYVVKEPPAKWGKSSPCWIGAEVGVTGRKVLIDISKAYIAETEE